MKRILAAALSLALLVSLAACGGKDRFDAGKVEEGVCYQLTGIAPDAVAMRVDGIDVPMDMYFYNLCYAASYMESYMNMYGMDLDWSMELQEGETVLDVTKDSILENTKSFAVIEKLAQENNVILDEAALSELETERAETVESLGGEESYRAELAKLGLSEETYDRMCRSDYLYSALEELAATEGSSLYATDEQLITYAAEQGYMTADHILLLTRDMSTYQELDDETKAEKKALAEELKAKLDAYTGDDLIGYFTELADEYSEDSGLGQNVARQVGVGAGLPYSVPAYTVGMVCGSGMKSVIEAGRAILAGDADIIVCGGTENMSAAPYASTDARWGARMGDKKLVDTMIKDGLWDAFNNYHMGTTAENICDVWGITREELDAFGVASQQKTEAAQAAGKFDAEIGPGPVKVKKEIVEFKRDEFPRAGASMEGLAKLKGAFPVGPEGVEDQIVHTFEPTEIHEADTRKHIQRVTAGQASGINDGAAAIVLASGEAVKKYNLKPMAKLIGWGQGGVDPKIMGVGPVPASRQAMAKAGVTIEDIDLVEANEAFAAQSIAVARELHFDMSKVNVNGGAISIGHPVGASGARIIVTLLHEMLKRPEAKKGLATLCIGGGQGVATVFEKC